ncbi:hypothetical protein D3C84_1295450 [compost metagenome]
MGICSPQRLATPHLCISVYNLYSWQWLNGNLLNNRCWMRCCNIEVFILWRLLFHAVDLIFLRVEPRS